ncbi:MAG: phosphate acyltransferase PlsX [Candidatus Palauibacterales bacterium]|nr:phosphate acyltransferase PlsX [Candidatus Palauibacterales bacterium]MDP2529358.1 phosphate acyltransferase PlsX [Candidatus Palauibacterales bacterium]MDP2583235.1 phosphate acyltransferase PlsX [Candidatus Palauibacterales bacterium]
MRIALDAMGGDDAPEVPVRAALSALTDGPEDLSILLVGDPDRLEPAVRDAGQPPERLRIVPAPQTIAMNEPPVQAVRRKPESSIVVGLRLQREGEADAFVSAGSTGAVLAASLFVLGRLPGVDRPTVGALFPTADRPVLVLDAGANVGCRPAHLHQFAHLGNIYVRDLWGVEVPRVGLLNVGEEEEKGDDLAVATHELLREDPELRFVGNVEGHRIIEGRCDVLVCDGFLGNVLLKFYESMAGFIVGLLRREQAQAGGRSREPGPVERMLDYTEYGGAPLLGVDGVVVLCHGSSPPRAIRNALSVAVDSVRADMVSDLGRDLEALSNRTRRGEM